MVTPPAMFVSLPDDDEGGCWLLRPGWANFSLKKINVCGTADSLQRGREGGPARPVQAWAAQTRVSRVFEVNIMTQSSYLVSERCDMSLRLVSWQQVVFVNIYIISLTRQSSVSHPRQQFIFDFMDIVWCQLTSTAIDYHFITRISSLVPQWPRIVYQKLWTHQAHS